VKLQVSKISLVFAIQEAPLVLVTKLSMKTYALLILPFSRCSRLGLAKGSYKNFKNQQSVFLSSQLAKKYFSQPDPTGETMTVTINNKSYEVIVGGVFEKLPLNISFHIEALMRIENYLDAYSIDQNRLDLQHESSVLFKLSDLSYQQIRWSADG
jgi:hypothetical protein